MADHQFSENVTSRIRPIADYYRILGLELGATKEMVTASYKRLLSSWDLAQYASDPAMKKKAEKIIAEIDFAYESVIMYLTHPQYQYFHPAPGRDAEDLQAGQTSERPAAPATLTTLGSAASAAGKVLGSISLMNAKPLSAASALFGAYAIIVLWLRLNRYETPGLNLLPYILKTSAGYLLPPFAVFAFYNLVRGDNRILKAASITVTLVWLIGVVPYSMGAYQRIFPGSTVSAEDPLLQADARQLVVQGTVARGKGRYQHALKCYTRALAAEPDNADAYYGRAMTYSLMGEDDAFLRDCRDAARFGHPDAVATLNRLDIKYR